MLGRSQRFVLVLGTSATFALAFLRPAPAYG